MAETKRPFLLLTGDDSVRAPGIILVKRLIESYADFAIVATKKQQSATGSRITWTGGQWGTELVDGTEAFWVDGTPSDAVYFAFSHLPRKPDLVISGMNMGSNMGNMIHRSGTVSAVVTATQWRDTPGVAVSFDAQDDVIFKEHDGSFDESLLEYPGVMLKNIIDQALRYSFPKETFWNVNFPQQPTTTITVRKAGQPDYYYNSVVVDSTNQRFMYEDVRTPVRGTDHDISAVEAGHICITPCRVEFTDHEQLPQLRTLFESKKAV